MQHETVATSKTAQPVRGRYDGMILSLLRDHDGLSRSAISERTGLSATTVTKAVNPLVAQGYVIETGADVAGRIGRPAIGLRLVPEAAVACGIQIGVGTVRAGLVDALGRVQRVIAFGFDPRADPVEVSTSLAQRVHTELIATSGTRILGVGVGAPGPVDSAHRVNLLSVNLDWRDVPLADVIERQCGRPATVDHNVRAMALAENRFGHRAASIAFVHLKTGVGLGLVLKNELFLGGNHGVSELGHLQVMDGGEKCACGASGCLETVAAEPALSHQLRELDLAEAETGGQPIALIDTVEFRPGVAEVRERFLGHLATGLAGTVNLLNPELIVVGGMLANASDAILTDLADATRARVFPVLRDSFTIRRTSFGDNAGVVGAATTALESFFYGPAPVAVPA